MPLLFVLFSIAAIVLLITRLKLHPFLALLLVSIALGLATSMKSELIISSIQDGFGSTVGKIGLIIILGVIIGAFLENTGGAMRLAQGILSLIGKKRVTTAMGIIGYIIAIPVFCDSGFVLLASLNRNLTRKAGLSLAGTAIALGLGLATTHTMVPPTPGPIAAAGILNADLALVMGTGLVAAAVALVAALFFARNVASKTYIDPGPVKETSEVSAHNPGLLRSSFPIVIPILLIILKSASGFWEAEGWQVPVKNILSFLGEPVIALLVGFAFCLLLPPKLEKRMFSAEGWVGKAMNDSAMIILVTGAGGIFGKMLENSGMASELGQALTESNMGIWLPFLLAAVLKSAQGSSTVSMITTASVMAPLMTTMGFVSETDKAMVVIAIGAGSLIVSHVNDSYFWVVTQLSGMDVKTGYRLHTTGTLIIGATAMAALYMMFIFLH
jgi:GntP family gluconate:H+ symporter